MIIHTIDINTSEMRKNMVYFVVNFEAFHKMAHSSQLFIKIIFLFRKIQIRH
jgi:hypothetical protein